MTIPHIIACWFAIGGAFVVLWMLCANGWYRVRHATDRSEQQGGEVGSVGLGVSHLGKGQ